MILKRAEFWQISEEETIEVNITETNGELYIEEFGVTEKQ